MRILLTFDYEIYFGEKTGTVEKCITGPTEMLMQMAERNGIRLVQFVDVGFLLKLEEYRHKYPVLNKDYDALCRQLDQLWKNGHDIQLHIHSHWEDSVFNGERWLINAKRYRLQDFSDAEISDIVRRYKARLEQITGQGQIYAFRAGGWCLQPFDRLAGPLRENGITVDSSVFPNGHFDAGAYYYDFRHAPLSDDWKFSTDPMIPDPDGTFTEMPIGSIYNSPLFYWRLFLLGRMFPHRHKPLGDGVPILAPGQRYKILSQWTHATVSVDGYNASLLNRAYHQYRAMKREQLVVIGHPKSLTLYGLDALNNFVRKRKDKNTFTTFRALAGN